MTRVLSRKMEWVPIETLRPYANNPKHHTAAAVKKLAEMIASQGWTQPIAVDADGVIVLGTRRWMAAQHLKLTDVPIIRLSELTPDEIRAARLADNRVAHDTAIDDVLVAEEMAALGANSFDLAATGYSPKEIAALMDPGGEAPKDERKDAVPELPKKAITKRGDVWILGQHRVMCGDSTSAEDVARLLGGAAIDLILTDPPYCSGGFQESGKRAGSVGTNRPHKQIANDTLSTRGYVALLRTAFERFAAPYLYCFTDWRMWTVLFDVVESSGLGVRSMIVWDKGTPGMGRGWRAQHELVMWACRKTAPWDKRAASAGNVIPAKRTGNDLHTTQKPAELLERITENTSFALTIADPFAGSGTTLIAAESKGRQCFAMELDPLYCDVIVERWQNYTTREAFRLSDDRSFNDEKRASEDG